MSNLLIPSFSFNHLCLIHPLFLSFIHSSIILLFDVSHLPINLFSLSFPLFLHILVFYITWISTLHLFLCCISGHLLFTFYSHNSADLTRYKLTWYRTQEQHRTIAYCDVIKEFPCLFRIQIWFRRLGILCRRFPLYRIHFFNECYCIIPKDMF